MTADELQKPTAPRPNEDESARRRRAGFNPFVNEGDMFKVLIAVVIAMAVLVAAVLAVRAIG